MPGEVPAYPRFAQCGRVLCLNVLLWLSWCTVALALDAVHLMPGGSHKHAVYVMAKPLSPVLLLLVILILILHFKHPPVMLCHVCTLKLALMYVTTRCREITIRSARASYACCGFCVQHRKCPVPLWHCQLFVTPPEWELWCQRLHAAVVSTGLAGTGGSGPSPTPPLVSLSRLFRAFKQLSIKTTFVLKL